MGMMPLPCRWGEGALGGGTHLRWFGEQESSELLGGGGNGEM